MPELNLDALKNRKRSTKKYRPYDIPEPSKPKVQVTENSPTKAFSSKKRGDNAQNERAIIDEKKPTQSVTSSEYEVNLKNKLEAEYKLKLKQKELEITQKLRGKIEQDDSLPSIVTTTTNNTFFNINDNKINNESLFKILVEIAKWDEPSVKFFMFLLEKTEFGKLKNVQIGRREIEHTAIHGRYFKDTRASLISTGVQDNRWIHWHL